MCIRDRFKIDLNVISIIGIILLIGIVKKNAIMMIDFALVAEREHGKSTTEAIFEGFLPHKKGRQTRLLKLAEEECTLVFYESPFRLVKTLEQFILVFGPGRLASCLLYTSH